MQLDDHPRVESGPRISAPEFGLVFVIILGPEIKFNFMAVFLKLGPMSPPGLWKCSKRSIKFQNGETLVMYNFLTLKMRKLRPKEGIFFFFFFKATQLVVEPELASGFLISWPWAFLILLH